MQIETNKIPKITITIPTYRRPEKLDRAVQVFVNNALSTDNFDFHFIVNRSDESYKETFERYDKFLPVKFSITQIDDTDYPFKEIIRAGIKHFLSTNNYFCLNFASDDAHFIGKDWDKHVLDTYKIFPDDLFLIHARGGVWGRQHIFFTSCYTNVRGGNEQHRIEDMKRYFTERTDLTIDDVENFIVLYLFCEIHPFMTYKFMEFVRDYFFNTPTAVSGADLVPGMLILYLYQNYGINRHVLANTESLEVEDNHNSNNILLKYLADFDLLKLTAQRMNEYIEKYHTMCVNDAIERRIVLNSMQ